MADQDKDLPLEREAASPTEKLLLTGTEEQQMALFEALAKASADFAPILNEAKGQIGNRQFTYADLDMLVQATRPALAKNGIIVLQPFTGPDQFGNHRISTIVAGHGAKLIAHLDYKKVQDVKEWGKQTTYLRRYGYRGMFVLDGSDDANNFEEQEAPARRNAQPTPPQGPPKEQKAKQPPREEKKAEAPKQSSPPPPPQKPTPAADVAPSAPAAAPDGASAAPAEGPGTAGDPAGGATSAPEEKRPSQPPPLPDLDRYLGEAFLDGPPMMPDGSPYQTVEQWAKDVRAKSPDLSKVDLLFQLLLRNRRPVIGEKVYAKFDRELVAQWTLHVTGKQKDSVTPEDKLSLILPALLALPKRQQELKGVL